MLSSNIKFSLICTGSVLISSGLIAYFVNHLARKLRRNSKQQHKSKEREDFQLDANGVPQALSDVFSPVPECSMTANDETGCCANDKSMACACTAESSSSAIKVARPNLGLPKKEYLALKKAGMLPPLPTVIPTAPTDAKRMLILYATQSGNAESFAKDLHEDACEKGFDASVHDLASFSVPDALAAAGAPPPTLVFLCSTWTGGQPPLAAQPFFAWLRDAAPPGAFAGVPFAVYALGNRCGGGDGDSCCGRESAINPNRRKSASRRTA